MDRGIRLSFTEKFSIDRVYSGSRSGIIRTPRGWIRMINPILPRGQAGRWDFVSDTRSAGVLAASRPILQLEIRVTSLTNLGYKRDNFPRGRGAERRFYERRSIVP